MRDMHAAVLMHLGPAGHSGRDMPLPLRSSSP